MLSFQLMNSSCWNNKLIHFYILGMSTKIKKKMFVECCVGRESQVQSQTFWRNEHPESCQILLWSWAVYFLNLYLLSTWQHQWSSEVTSIVQCFCNAACWLELEEKCTLINEHKVTERKDSNTLTCVHVFLHSIVIWLFGAECTNTNNSAVKLTSLGVNHNQVHQDSWTCIWPDLGTHFLV